MCERWKRRWKGGMGEEEKEGDGKGIIERKKEKMKDEK